jgi:predicted Zn-dependent peptidase
MTRAPAQALRLENGLTVVVETLPEVRSAAYALLVPAGSAWDPPGHNGIASTLCDWMTRGAGDLGNRDFSIAVDRLGLQHNQNVSASHLSFTGACLREHLEGALELTAAMVVRPQCRDEEFEPSIASVLFELQALEDEPRQKVMLELIRRCYPQPWNQPPEGAVADVEALTPEIVRAHGRRLLHPNETILGIAGNISFEAGVALARRTFGDWSPGTLQALELGPRGNRREHMAAEAQQTQIGVAFPAVPYRHPDYYAAWAAVGVLSGGMSARLFTEVREKRGLCYSVYATLSTLREEGAVLCYAGTTNERAQETLDVLLEELARLEQGIADDELRRAKALAQSSLVMQQESASARAGSIARDWYHLGRVVPVDEVQQRIAALTPPDLVDYVRRHPLRDGVVVTIGPQPLQVPMT